MSLIAINPQPTGSESHWDTTVVLDGQRVRFAFYTNRVDGAWHLDIENDDGSAAVRGIGLVGGVDLLYRFRYLALPPGPLWLEGDEDLDAFAEKRARLLYQEVGA